MDGWKQTQDPVVQLYIFKGIPKWIFDQTGFTVGDYRKAVSTVTGIDKDKICIPAAEWRDQGDGAICPVYIEE